MSYRTFVAAVAAMLGALSPTGTDAQQRIVAVPIEAGGQRCIAWTFVKDVRGVYDSSRVNYRNTCAAPVSFYLCHAEVYGVGSWPPCDAQRGSYYGVDAPVGWTKSDPSSARAGRVIVIRECPPGTRTDGSRNGRFYCRR